MVCLHMIIIFVSWNVMPFLQTSLLLNFHHMSLLKSFKLGLRTGPLETAASLGSWRSLKAKLALVHWACLISHSSWCQHTGEQEMRTYYLTMATCYQHQTNGSKSMGLNYLTNLLSPMMPSMHLSMYVLHNCLDSVDWLTSSLEALFIC